MRSYRGLITAQQCVGGSEAEGDENEGVRQHDDPLFPGCVEVLESVGSSKVHFNIRRMRRGVSAHAGHLTFAYVRGVRESTSCVGLRRVMRSVLL